MPERPKQRRPPKGRASYVADDDFRKKLSALLKTKTSTAVAAEVGAASGYLCDPSLVRKLNNGTATQSWLVGEIAKVYGWPIPSRAAGDAGDVMSALDEIRAGNPEAHARLVRVILQSRDHEREISQLERGTPENDEE